MEVYPTKTRSQPHVVKVREPEEYSCGYAEVERELAYGKNTTKEREDECLKANPLREIIPKWWNPSALAPHPTCTKKNML